MTLSQRGVCGRFKVADFDLVVPDMKLSPNVGSDRSWVWNAAADVSEGEPEPCTLAIRFANPESKIFRDYREDKQTNDVVDANLFKDAFVKAQQENEKLFGPAESSTEAAPAPAVEKEPAA